jgi:hypothetical protein
MRVRMLTTAAGPDGVYRVGEIWTVDPITASQLIAGNFAVSVDTNEAPAAVETAVLSPPENADARPRGAKRTPATR